MIPSKKPRPQRPPLIPISPEQRLDVKDVAAILRRGVSGIWAAVKRGDFPSPERYGNRCTRWRWGTIQEYLNKIAEVLP